MQFDLGWNGAFTWTRGNAEKMRLTYDGKVGIGTANPQDKLEIASGYLRMYDPSSSTGAGYFLQWSSDNGGSNVTYAGIDAITTSAGARTGDLRFFTSNAGAPTEKVRITSAGNVGIGTTSPSYKQHTVISGATGDIAGFSLTGNVNNPTLLIKADATNQVITFRAGSNTATYPAIAFDTGTGGEKMRITSAGNVGIGTTSPSAKLEVYAGSDTTANTILWGQTIRNGGNAATTGYGVGLKLKNSTDSVPNELYKWAGVAAVAGSNYSNRTDLAFYTNTSSSVDPTEKVRITGDGNLGIGTIAPGAPLSVAGVGGSTKGTDGYLVNIGGTDSNVDPVRYMIGFTHGNTYTAGNVRAAVGMMVTTGGAGNLVFETGSSGAGQLERMRINGSGDVGIGTTAPSEKLHVDGSVVVTYNNSYQGINSVGNKAILARVSPTAGIVNYAEYATATNLNGFVMGSDDARVKGNIATDSLELITNGSTRMTVLSSGYVGVNTTTPGTNFHVVGDVLIQTGALGVGVNPNATDGRIDASNDIVAYSSSDRRLKENITPIANALDKVKSLTGVEFDWKEETKSAHGYEGHDTGVIAQEVQEVMPTAVRTNDTGYLAVRYEKMIGLLIEAMKEQQTQIDELKAKLDGLTK